MTICNIIIPNELFLSLSMIYEYNEIQKTIYAHRADKLKENINNCNHDYQLLKFVRKVINSSVQIALGSVVMYVGVMSSQ